MSDETRDGIWLTITENKVQRLIEVVHFERTGSAGRPTKVVTEDGLRYIERMARRGCILEDIAEEMGVSKPVLFNSRNKAAVSKSYKKGVAECDNRLRAAQVSRALDGNATMLVWLGRVRLGQREQEAESSGELAAFVKAMQSRPKGDPEEET